MHPWFKFRLLLVVVGVGILGSLPARARNFPEGPSLEPFAESGIYEVGDTVGWTVHRPAGKVESAEQYTYEIKKNNFETIASGEIDLAAGPSKISVSVA